MKNERRRFLRQGAAVLSTLGVSSWSQTAPYPSGTIRVIAPTSPGGGVDLLARETARILSDSLGVSAIVENKPGGSGVIGKDLVAKARADGHTLLMGSQTLALDGLLHANMPFDVNDFAPVIYLGFVPLVLVTQPSFPANNVKELIALAKSRPGKITFAMGGSGAGSHLSGEMFKYLSGTDLLMVPYKGNAPALTDVVSGHVNIMWDIMTTTLPQIRAGRLKALAVTSSRRSSVTPEYPTMIESGLPGFEINAWYMLFAPKNTPADVVQKLNGALHKGYTNPEFVKRMAAQGIEVVGGSVADARGAVQREIDRWVPIFKAANIKAE
ncbi:MAG: tripartite tricarboxylate transporter substrate binding protein [Pseudomonadota bacterium]